MIATDCAAPFTDGGAPSPSVSVFAGPTLARTLLAPYTSYATDPAGAWLWVEDAGGEGKLVRASDGATLFTDQPVSGPGFFDATGGTLYYASSGALKSVSTASPTPKTIVPSGCGSLVALSPDGEKVLFRQGSEVYLERVTGGSAPTLLWSHATTPLGEYLFSADSGYVIVLSDVPHFGYKLEWLSVDGGGVVAGGASRLRSLSLLAGSKAFAATQAGGGQVLDLSGKEAPLDLPSVGTFALSQDRTRIAYEATAVEVPGLYVLSTGSAAGKLGDAGHD